MKKIHHTHPLRTICSLFPAFFLLPTAALILTGCGSGSSATAPVNLTEVKAEASATNPGFGTLSFSFTNTRADAYHGMITGLKGIENVSDEELDTLVREVAEHFAAGSPGTLTGNETFRPIDAEKYSDKSCKEPVLTAPYGDSQLCWAASCANMLYYSGWGSTSAVGALPEDIVSEAHLNDISENGALENEDLILSVFTDAFPDEGSYHNDALKYYLNGIHTKQYAAKTAGKDGACDAVFSEAPAEDDLLASIQARDPGSDPDGKLYTPGSARNIAAEQLITTLNVTREDTVGPASGENSANPVFAENNADPVFAENNAAPVSGENNAGPASGQGDAGADPLKGGVISTSAEGCAQAIMDAIDRGASVGTAIVFVDADRNARVGTHALTIFGYIADANGSLAGLVIADSDNDLNRGKAYPENSSQSLKYRMSAPDSFSVYPVGRFRMNAICYLTLDGYRYYNPKMKYTDCTMQQFTILEPKQTTDPAEFETTGTCDAANTPDITLINAAQGDVETVFCENVNGTTEIPFVIKNASYKGYSVDDAATVNCLFHIRRADGTLVEDVDLHVPLATEKYTTGEANCTFVVNGAYLWKEPGSYTVDVEVVNITAKDGSELPEAYTGNNYLSNAAYITVE